MRDYRFMVQLPTDYLQKLLVHGGLSPEEKQSARTVLQERKAPFKIQSHRKPGKRHKSKSAPSLQT